MIILDNVVVTDEFLNAKFCCDLPQCKGWCCVEGDAGAPLESSEISQIEDNLEAIKAYMRPEGLKVIEEGDVYDYDENGELVTPLVNGAECAFVYFHENGTALCAIEKPIWKANVIFGNRYPATSTLSVWLKKTVLPISFITNGAFVFLPNAKAKRKAFHFGNS